MGRPKHPGNHQQGNPDVGPGCVKGNITGYTLDICAVSLRSACKRRSTGSAKGLPNMSRTLRGSDPDFLLITIFSLCLESTEMCISAI